VSAPSWGQVKELLHQALALDAQARAQFLDEVGASDAALRIELESLLSVGDGLSPEFLGSPAAAILGAGDDAFSAAGLAEGQQFAERFQLIRKLGEGGMGQVWLAEQTLPVRRLVALKLIRAGMYDEAVVRRFQSERQSLAIMDHPAIAKVFDAGATPQGQPYLIMEYVPTAYAFPLGIHVASQLGFRLVAKRQLPDAYAGCGENRVSECRCSWRNTRLAESAHGGITCQKMHIHVGRFGQLQESIVVKV
jgi:hypothetical protein